MNRVVLAANTTIIRQDARNYTVRVMKPDWRNRMNWADVNLMKSQTKVVNGRIVIPDWLAKDYNLPSEPWV